MLYQDNKMYSSPGQMHQLPDDPQQLHNHMYQQSPMANPHGAVTVDELDLNNFGMYGTIDPNSLGQHHHQQH